MSNKTPPTEAKMVPVEPTEEMVRAFYSAIEKEGFPIDQLEPIPGTGQGDYAMWERWRTWALAFKFAECYRAMLAAAPDQGDGSREFAEQHRLMEREKCAAAVCRHCCQGDVPIKVNQHWEHRLPGPLGNMVYGANDQPCAATPIWNLPKVHADVAARKDAPEQAVAIPECINVRCNWCARSLVGVSCTDQTCDKGGLACGLKPILRLAAHPPRLDAQTVERVLNAAWSYNRSPVNDYERGRYEAALAVDRALRST